MSLEDVQLVEPTAELRESYLAMVHEFREAGERFQQDYYDDLADFPAMVRKLRGQSRGDSLPEGYVPCSHYWLVRGGAVVLGTSRLRHRLMPRLEHEGGHIGYDIRPSERGKGYATHLLALTLEKARAVGVREALLTCDTDNAASARVIERNGGRLAGRGFSERTGKAISRYWIDLGPRREERGHG